MRETKLKVWDSTLEEMVGPFTLFEISCRLEGLFNNEDSCIIIQYTGRKDCGNKEIYDGDIVNFKFPKHGPQYYIGVIRWSDDYLCWIVSAYYKYPKGMHSYRVYEVTNLEIIGNIFQNKGLIEKEV